MLGWAPFATGSKISVNICIFLGLSLTAVACSPHSEIQEKDSRLPLATDQFEKRSVEQQAALPDVLKFWVDPNSQAMEDSLLIQPQDGPDARRIRYIAQQSAGVWYGEWSEAIGPAVQAQIEAAKSDDSYAVLIAYNIPYRDCGQHSAGGASASEYKIWIRDFAAALRGSKAIVILEPDALTLNNCLSEELKSERYNLLREAIGVLKENPTTLVYLDAGHSAWLSADETAQRLQRAGVAIADGFALNTSNYQSTESNIQFGNAVRNVVGRDKSFVIDTSRNGAGPSPNNEWCNPSGRALGKLPTSSTGHEGVDAFLWLKRPGESDGECNGGPAAGAWWREIAIELARNAGI